MAAAVHSHVRALGAATSCAERVPGRHDIIEATEQPTPRVTHAGCADSTDEAAAIAVAWLL